MPGQADILGGRADPCPAEESFAGLDGLPALFEGGEVPALTAAADHPEATLRRIEGKATADGEGLHDLVRAEGLLAERAGPVHGGRERSDSGEFDGYHVRPSHPATATVTHFITVVVRRRPSSQSNASDFRSCRRSGRSYGLASGGTEPDPRAVFYPDDDRVEFGVSGHDELDGFPKGIPGDVAVLPHLELGVARVERMMAESAGRGSCSEPASATVSVGGSEGPTPARSGGFGGETSQAAGRLPRSSAWEDGWDVMPWFTSRSRGAERVASQEEAYWAPRRGGVSDDILTGHDQPLAYSPADVASPRPPSWWVVST